MIRAATPQARANYRSLLSGPNVAVVTDGEAADVVLVEVTAQRGRPQPPHDEATPVLLLISDGASAAASAEIAASNRSHVTEGISKEQLLAALQAAAAGLLVREPASRPVTVALGTEASGTELSLTDRERHVLRLLGEGLGNREIAVVLGLSDHTVKFHLHSVFAKLGAQNRTEAVSIAVRRGLLLL